MNEQQEPQRGRLDQIIRASLAETQQFGWEDDDRKWSACGAALKYIEAHRPDLAEAEAQRLAISEVERVMSEEVPPL